MDSTSLSTRLQHARVRAAELSFPRLLALLYCGSLLAHLVVALFFLGQPIALDDMYQYDMLGRSLAAGNGFRWYSQADVEVLRPYYAQFLDIDHLPFPPEGLLTTFRAPGYPSFLALLYLLVPAAQRFALARLVQVGLAAFLAPLAALLAEMAGFRRKAAVTAGLVMSLYPILLFYPIGLASEDLYVLLAAASLAAIAISVRKGSWGWTLLAGVLGGLTLLTRSIFAVFVLLAGVWIARHSPRRIPAGLVFLLTAFGLCLPWSVRNSLILQRPSFVENNLGYNLFIGYNPEGDGGFVSAVAIQPMNVLDDGQREQDCFRQALAFIRQDPFEAGRRVLVRLAKFLGPETREFFYFYSNDQVGAVPGPWLLVVASLLVIPWAAVLLGGVAGLWLARRDRLTVLVLCFLAGYGLPHLFIIAEPRFHLAWVPVLLPYAASAWTGGFRQSFDRQNRPLLLILLAVLLVFGLSFAADFPKLLAILGPGGNLLRFSY